MSSLGQPLVAEIPVQAVSKEEAESLKVKLASPDVFHMANIEYKPVLNSLRFTLTERNGTPVIRVSSAQPINDLYVDMLLEVEANGSNLIREYSFMLDPADLRKPQPVQMGSVTPQAETVVQPAAQVQSSNDVQKGSSDIVSTELDMAPQDEGVPDRQPPAVAQKPGPSATSQADRAGQPTPEQLAAAAAAIRQANAEMKGEKATGAVQARKESQNNADLPAEVSAKLPESGNVADSIPSEVEVVRGDTLSKIARQVKPEGVSLDQMLVALQRANPKAFDGNNMNRLRTGQILTIPDTETAKEVPRSEASRIVVAQAVDFTKYKERLAGQVAIADPQGDADSRQSAAGRIATQVEEQKNPVSEAKDKLQLSKSGVATADNRAGSITAGTEERIAREKALEEANSRIAELEKNNNALQKLLELKNKDLAERQAQLDAASKAGSAGAGNAVKGELTPVVPGPAQTPAGQQPAQQPAVQPAPAQAAGGGQQTGEPAAPPVATEPPAAAAPAPQTPVASAPAVAPAKKPVPRPTPVAPPETSLVDHILGHPLLLPLVGVLGALGVVGVVVSRRKKKRDAMNEASLQGNSLFGSTGGQSVDTNNSVFDSNFSPSASQLDTNEVDPIAEADVYIAYQKDDQAEEILKEALRTQPGRNAVRVKLLEIYARRNDAAAFEENARELHRLTRGKGEDWMRAAAMGAEIDPDNPLYTGGAVQTTVGLGGQKKKHDAADDLDLGALLNSTEQSSRKPAPPVSAAVLKAAPPLAAAPALAPEPPELDFNLDLSDLGGSAAARPAAPLEQPESLADIGGMDFQSSSVHGSGNTLMNVESFLADEDEPANEAPSAAGSRANEIDFDLSGINLDLSPGSASGANASPSALRLSEAAEMQNDAGHEDGLDFTQGSLGSDNLSLDSLDFEPASGSLAELPDGGSDHNSLDLPGSLDFPQASPTEDDLSLDGLDFTQGLSQGSSLSPGMASDNAVDGLGISSASQPADDLSLEGLDFLQENPGSNSFSLDNAFSSPDIMDMSEDPAESDSASLNGLSLEGVSDLSVAKAQSWDAPAAGLEPVAEPLFDPESVRLADEKTAPEAAPQIATGPVTPAPMPNGPISTETELTTKLDLALAYREIGDKEGARELLEEVVASGHAGFAQKAKELLQRIA